MKGPEVWFRSCWRCYRRSGYKIPRLCSLGCNLCLFHPPLATACSFISLLRVTFHLCFLSLSTFFCLFLPTSFLLLCFLSLFLWISLLREKQKCRTPKIIAGGPHCNHRLKLSTAFIQTVLLDVGIVGDSLPYDVIFPSFTRRTTTQQKYIWGINRPAKTAFLHPYFTLYSSLQGRLSNS